MKSISTFLINLVLLVVVFSACKSKKSTTTSHIPFETHKQFSNHYFEGSKNKILGKYEEAIINFNKSLGVISNQPDAYYQLANIYFKLKNNEQAIKYGELSIKYSKTYNHWFYGQLAQFYASSKEYKKSAEIFKKMVEQEPKKESNYTEAAYQLLNAGEVKESVKYFEMAIDKFGPKEEVVRKLEDIYLQNNQTEKAIAVIQKLINHEPNNIKYLGLLAELYILKKDNENAKTLYLKMLEKDPNNGFANFGLAELEKANNDENASFEYLIKGFKDNRVQIQHKLKIIGSYYELMAKDAKYISKTNLLANELVLAHPNEAKAYVVKADVLYASNNLEESRFYFIKSLDLDPKDYRVWQRLLGLDNTLKSDSLLYVDSKKALELFPTYINLYIVNSYAANAQKNYSEAVEVAEQGMVYATKNEEKIQLYLNAAQSYHYLKNFQTSDDYSKKTLELNQSNIMALNNYAYYLILRNEQMPFAETLILKALKLDNENPIVIDTYAWLLYTQNKYNDAEKWCKKAIDMSLPNADFYHHYADILFKLNQKDNAINFWKKALELDKNNQIIKQKIKNAG